MNDAEKIVEALLEGDDESEKPKKKLPPWLAKIKGEPVDDEEGEGDGEKKDDAKGSGGGSKGGGGGAKSSDTTVGKTW